MRRKCVAIHAFVIAAAAVAVGRAVMVTTDLIDDCFLTASVIVASVALSRCCCSC